MKIVDIREATKPIKSDIRNAVHRFQQDDRVHLLLWSPTSSATATRSIGFGFNSNGRYGLGCLFRERFIPRVLQADPNIAPVCRERDKPRSAPGIWRVLMINEKPGGHGERSVAVGTIDMAVWDAVALDR